MPSSLCLWWETLLVDRQAADLFGEIIADLRRIDRPVPTNDIWIAATCARTGATLLTWDAHFRLIPRVGSVVIDHPIGTAIPPPSPM
jgi:predicted nucleic acid-binding protein